MYIISLWEFGIWALAGIEERHGLWKVVPQIAAFWHTFWSPPLHFTVIAGPRVAPRLSPSSGCIMHFWILWTMSKNRHSPFVWCYYGRVAAPGVHCICTPTHPHGQRLLTIWHADQLLHIFRNGFSTLSVTSLCYKWEKKYFLSFRNLSRVSQKKINFISIATLKGSPLFNLFLFFLSLKS